MKANSQFKLDVWLIGTSEENNIKIQALSF